MRESAKKKRVPRKREPASSKGRQEAMNKKQSRPVKDQQNDSEAIERAVYDGMQDLRADKSK
jgi:hypothetical protein